MFLLQQVSKELFKEKTRIMLTILAIAWGTFAISSMLAIGEGLRVTFAQTMANTGHNLLVIRGGRTTKSYRGQHANAKINLTKADANSIAKLPNVAAMSPVYSFTPKLYLKPSKVYSRAVLAVPVNYALIHEIKVLPGGRFISPLDINQQRSVIVLGTKTRDEIFPRLKNPTGRWINLGNKPFLIVGVMQHKSQMAGRRGADAFNNWIPITTYELMTNPQLLSSIDITYKNPDLLAALEAHIQQIVALNHGANPTDDNVVHLREFAKRQQKINSFFLGMQIFLGIVGILTLMVAAVGIANVMYASVNNATHEIGIRIAIGARTYQILAHYIAEAMAATFIGGLLGLLLSWLLVYGLRRVPMHGKLFQVIGQPRPELSLLVVVVVVIVLGVIGFLAGLFPALKASRVDPAEALAYE